VEMNLNRGKKMEMEEKMEMEKQKMEMEEKKEEVKEEKMEKEEEKPKAKIQCTSLYNKYKRKREDEEDTGEYNIYKKSSLPGYFQYGCELLANDEKTLYEIFKEYPSIFTRHYKSLERIVYERDRLKKKPVREVTWIFGSSNTGEIEWVDKYIDSYDTIHKLGNYYLGLTGDKNIVYNLLLA
jgi:hypothetical protein